MKELHDLRKLFHAVQAMRSTAVVDDEFPHLMGIVDRSIYTAKESLNTLVITDINSTCEAQYEWVERMGWHNKTVLEALALITKEVGKAVNECRGEAPTEIFGEELADICLRVFDLAQWQEIDLQAAINRKMAINEGRGTRGRRI